MKLYCQLDYKHIPYPSPISVNGNIADNGCGVCCVSMIVEEILGISFDVETCAKFSKQSGARQGFGTNMAILSSAIAEKFKIEVIPTYDTNEVLEFLLDKQGYVIANTIGDREDWIGVFSDARHYIVLCDAYDHTVGVLDPLYREGRYDVEGRKGKVKMVRNVAYADFSVVENDCMGKCYYMFKKVV